MDVARYALYFAPDPDTALDAFGQGWLGPASPVPPAWTAEPRRYGFHATLKAPFHLAPGQTQHQLFQAAQAFAARQVPFVTAPLRLSVLAGFLALTPFGPSPDINDLADGCVRDFDRFRAPLSDRDRARRLETPLGERERAHLDRWGYPFVFDTYRFHMTLTGRLGAQDLATAQALAQDRGRDALSEPVAFCAVCLFCQPTPDAPFQKIGRFALGEIKNPA